MTEKSKNNEAATLQEAAENSAKMRQYAFDDSGNSDLLRDEYRNTLRYSFTEKVWYFWNGKKWTPDPGGLIMCCVDETIKKLEKGTEFMRMADSKGGAAHHLAYTRSLRGMDAMEKAARHKLAISAGAMDRDITRFNARNGTISLTNGKLCPHNEFDYSTKLGGCELGSAPDDPEREFGEDCPLWRRFLLEIFGYDEELIRFVQKACGYSMTGEISEQCLFFLYGAGRNGKTTFLKVLSDIFGDYAMNIMPQTIMEQRFAGSGAPTPDVARLKGARFVTTVEPNEGERLNEGLIKQLTGGDIITARYLYGKEFEFTPQFKLWIAANNKPVIRGNDLGIWRRIRLIPFSVTIPEEKADKKLPEKLKREYPAILRWILEGCMLWRNEGLGTAQKVEESTQEYRMEMDSVATFLEECTSSSPSGRVKASELYSAYRKWCDEAGRLAKNVTKFGVEVAKRYEKLKNASGNLYAGIELNNSVL